MTTVVGFISEKGGVGKTTACYHIAVGLKRYHGKRVLVVDTDYQRGASLAASYRSYSTIFARAVWPLEHYSTNFSFYMQASPLISK